LSNKLIIDNPQGQSRAQRATSAVLTWTAWIVLLYILVPFFAFFLGLRQFAGTQSWVNLTTYDTWADLAPLIPAWGLAALGMIATLYLWATVQFLRFRHSRRKANSQPVTPEELSQHCGHPESDVRNWIGSKRLVADYDEDTNRMDSVSTDPNAPFRRNPKEGERSAPAKESAKPVTAEEGVARRRAMLESEIEDCRKQTLQCYVKIDALELVLVDVVGTKSRHTPDRDIELYRQLKIDKENLRTELANLQRRVASCRLLIESLDSLQISTRSKL
jgi:poly-beta-1,6-N-acetyl-D-glucosamine biosynthesis protein PgaD